jgi:hypothetical protein
MSKERGGSRNESAARPLESACALHPKAVAMNVVAYFRQLAQRCYQLATRCFDLGTAGKLNAMGDELIQKSRDLDTTPTTRAPLHH